MMRLFEAVGAIGVAAAFMLAMGALGSRPAVAGDSATLVLEDFRSKDPEGFPIDWQHESQRSHAKGREAYKIQSEDSINFLAAKDAGQRVKKRKIEWDPKQYPVLTWKWRLHKAPAGSEPIAVIYASLDTDLLFIPVFTKYVWSATKPEGTLTEGGMFSGSEIVVQGGMAPLGEWVEERVNVYEDFKRIHQHEPAAKAWGISIFAGPGVEIDFGPIAAVSAR
ncbi:MAG TPA: DUF3047 domain-containing protein [Nitrospiraceae bacterium]|nr:DUF3047 domain-containing protein [Nitrospiraceae bacterium]